jgi:hypothetical protein
MKNSIKDSSEQGQLIRRLAQHVKTWGEPQLASVFDGRYVERLTHEMDFKPHNMSQGVGGTWTIKLWIGGKPRAIAYFHREEQWKAALVADVAFLVLWPHRSDYDGKVVPPDSLMNYRPDEVYGCTLENSEWGERVRDWANLVNDAIVRFGWARSVSPNADGETPKRDYRTITDSFNRFQWEVDDRLGRLEKGQAQILAAIDTVHQERNDFLDAHMDVKATLDVIAQSMTELLKFFKVACNDEASKCRAVGEFQLAGGSTVCPGCGNMIDTELCHCGDAINMHGTGSGHSPVPMGCTCGYPKQVDVTCGCSESRRCATHADPDAGRFASPSGENVVV